MSAFDTSVPHPARRYDYWLGGKDNFAADRESGDAIAAQFPGIRTAVVENRRFLRRAVTYLAESEGVRQFLDVGTGLPTAGNTHEVAQGIAGETRVVYVDNDPLVLAHARALLTGATSYVDADARDPGKILEEARRTLDFEQPIALMLLAVLHFVTDDDDPYGLVRTFVEALPPGSFVALSHASGDWLPAEVVASITSGRHGAGRLRSQSEVARFFDGLDVLPPGVVPLPEWRDGTEEKPRPEAAEVSMYAGIARKP
ncbi:SAM-dependent methyltransferase [Actinoplanes sp. LDG1-06]|uniref:SAM-dependent methyltransferase n=1 Tax=Paractinoplanes ovalisporus TaxID=2810368 RepID=A0ABS2A7U8_9ACTN|nr:SAM-dependent methyltransferase [Actinoplanes ovalisporus]MBM2615901.1 SAM-dependent methyltransferase [Actinoplanes ovalisporus]